MILSCILGEFSLLKNRMCHQIQKSSSGSQQEEIRAPHPNSLNQQAFGEGFTVEDYSFEFHHLKDDSLIFTWNGNRKQ